jgi:hypothetical protein
MTEDSDLVGVVVSIRPDERQQYVQISPFLYSVLNLIIIFTTLEV